MNNKMYKKLIEVAEQDTVITYSRLNSELGLGLNFESPGDRVKMSDMLGEISEHEFEHDRPLLSGVVIEKKVPLFPAHGFFSMAKKLGVQSPKVSDVTFWAQELTRLYNTWRKNDNTK